MRISRRDVLSGLSMIGLSAGLLGGRRTAHAANDDYRALVCVFLFGGNDGNNMVVPVDARYADYATARRQPTDGGLASRWTSSFRSRRRAGPRCTGSIPRCPSSSSSGTRERWR